MEPAVGMQLSPVFGVPRVPRSVVSPPRLSRLVEQALDENDVIVVRSGGGSGKTVALADWAAGRTGGEYLSWITLDDWYADRRTFWHEVIRGTAVRVDERRSRLMHDCLDALDAGIDPRVVLHRFAPHIPPTLVVIDKLELVTDELLLEDFVWVMQNSRLLKAVVSSRTRTPLESRRTGLVLDVAVVDAAQLEFTVAETAELLNRHGVGMDPLELHKATGGHPLLTRAAMEVHEQDDAQTPAQSVREAISSLFDFRAEAAVGRDVLQFMARTAIPESLTNELAVAISCRTDASVLLHQFEEKGWGMWFNQQNHFRFRYGTAVRAALQEEARHLDPRDTDQVLRKVIDHQLSVGDFLGALRDAVRIGDLDLASSIARDHHMKLLMSQTEAVKEILDGIPLTRMRKHPVLIMALALCYNTTSGGHRRAVELFGLAASFSRVYAKSVAADQRIWMLTLESAALRFAGNLETAVRQASRAVESFEEAPLSLHDELKALEPTLYTQAGIAFLHVHDFDRAVELLTKGLDTSRRTSMVANEFLVTGLLAFTLSLSGHMARCRVLLTRLQEAQ